MARTNALVKCSIWDRESNFRALTRAGQRVYLLVLSQPLINNCGIVPYVPERWWRMAADDNRDDFDQALAELTRERYVIVDEETGELLVRTFIRHDRIEGQPNLIKAAWREWRAIESDTLRALLAEMHPWLAQDDLTRAVAQARANAEDTTTETPSATPSERTSTRRGSERGSGTPPRTRARPRPRTPTPSPTPESAKPDSGGRNHETAVEQSSPGVAQTTATNGKRPAIDIARDRIRNIGAELPTSALTAELKDALDQRYDELADDQLVELRDLHAALAAG